jgi:hypothetical protein
MGPNSKWAGAKEWEVQDANGNDTGHRIVTKGDLYGYVLNHIYGVVKEFPAPWY